MPRLKICSCGALFEPKPWQVKYGRDKLCPACTPPDPHHSPEYRAARKKRMVLAGRKCEQCRSTYKLQCHHEDGNPDNHTVANLRILCLRCHRDKTRMQLAEQGRRYDPKIQRLVPVVSSVTQRAKRSGRPRPKHPRASRKSTKSMRLV